MPGRQGHPNAYSLIPNHLKHGNSLVSLFSVIKFEYASYALACSLNGRQYLRGNVIE
ncbi:hypothetical protein LEP1GSC039_0668 [Leptospira santarosai str. 2000027870]|nr:hypothetical protein LEP1GSC039_0668 [Leptospira santarosai str. 2000027870]